MAKHDDTKKQWAFFTFPSMCNQREGQLTSCKLIFNKSKLSLAAD